jgi:hypothetical protein
MVPMPAQKRKAARGGRLYASRIDGISVSLSIARRLKAGLRTSEGLSAGYFLWRSSDSVIRLAGRAVLGRLRQYQTRPTTITVPNRSATPAKINVEPEPRGATAAT